MAVVLDLPYPPTANLLWRRAVRGMRKSDDYCAWLREAGWRVKQQRAGNVPGAYKLSITAVRPDRRRRDLDNIIKPISDLLKAVGVIDDDSLCEMITARWVTSGEGVTVRIEPAGVEA